MKLRRRIFLQFAGAAVAAPVFSHMATAQTYPARPITIVVPYAAGGQSDVVARVVGEHMRATLGQPVLIENVVGAGGAIGLRRVARAPSDGYTIMMGNWATHVALGAIYQLDFDLLDFAPVAQLPGQPGLIATRKTVPVSNLRELIAWLSGPPSIITNETEAVGKALQQRPGHRVLPVIFDVCGPMRGSDENRTAAYARNGKIDAILGPTERHRLLAMRRRHICNPLRGLLRPYTTPMACPLLFPNLTNETIPLAGERANDALPLAAVVDSVANRAYSAAEGRFRHNAAVPHC